MVCSVHLRGGTRAYLPVGAPTVHYKGSELLREGVDTGPQRLRLLYRGSEHDPRDLQVSYKEVGVDTTT